MKMIRWIAVALCAALLAACGGGGGSPGATNGGGGQGPGSTPTGTPTLTLSLVDSTGMATNTISNTGSVFAKATAKDASGSPVAGSVVAFASGSTAAVRFVPDSGTALTGADGTATVQVLPASSTSSGAGSLTASATVGGASLTASATYQIPVGASDPATAKVADFIMLLDRSTLQNAGTATAKLTVLTVDSGNNIVPGAKVVVTTNANTIFTPSGTATDANGTFTGSISYGADKSDRTVTITATVNGIVKQTTLQVVGSNIALSTNPAIPAPGSAAMMIARLTDGGSQPIANATLTFAGDIAGLSGKSVKTDASGTATVLFTAPSKAGSYIVLVSGNGTVNSVSVQVGSPTTIPPATIPAGVIPALSALPNVVQPNTAGSTANQSPLRFLMIDQSNKPVPNVRVRFAITSTGLGSFDSSISTGQSIVYTNAAGEATAAFVPGSTDSPTDGVVVRACYAANDFPAAECPNSVEVRLTVASLGLAISIGNDNKISSANGLYTKEFVVTVADAAGRPVPDATVDIFVDLPYYTKGLFAAAMHYPLLVQPIERNQYYPDASTVPTASDRVTCINQDLNRNGMVDLGGPRPDPVTNTDGFGQWVLLPRKSDLIIMYSKSGVKKTDEKGVLNIQVQYSQRFATWLEYHIRASTTVSGSQGTAERAFVTTYAKEDEAEGSFRLSPYGFGACDKPD